MPRPKLRMGAIISLYETRRPNRLLQVSRAFINKYIIPSHSSNTIVKYDDVKYDDVIFFHGKDKIVFSLMWKPREFRRLYNIISYI